MADQDDVEQQRALLQTYRRSLALYLEQRVQHSSAFAPPLLLSNIREAREHIQRIKAHLREHGIAVEDHLVDTDLTLEERLPGVIRPANRVLGISAAVLAVLLVLGAGMWWALPAALRRSLPSPTAAVAPSPDVTSPSTNPSLSAASSVDPQYWPSVVRVTSAAFLDENTCWLLKELPETIRPDGDPRAVQAYIKQAQDERRVPLLSATQGVTIPLQVDNIVKDGETLALEPKMIVTVHVQQPILEHVNTVTTCGGMGLGTYRTFAGVSLIQTANVEQYKLPITTPGDFFFVEPGRFERFQVPLICSSPGIYTLTFELPYTYAGQPGRITFASPEILCPKSYTVWLFSGEQEALRRMASYTWTESGYEKTP
jgi:hypothetical protein